MDLWPAHLFLCPCWLSFRNFPYRAHHNLFCQEQEENFSCPHFCIKNLETEGRLCLIGTFPGASATSSRGVSTFLSFTFLSSTFASSILFSISYFSHGRPVLFSVAPGCVHSLSLLFLCWWAQTQPCHLWGKAASHPLCVEGQQWREGDTGFMACFWGKHGAGGHQHLGKTWGRGTSTSPIPLQKWLRTMQDDRKKWRPGSLFTLLETMSPKHLSVDVRYGALIKLCKQPFIHSYSIAWCREKLSAGN